MAIALPTRPQALPAAPARSVARPLLFLHAWSAFLFLYGINTGDLYRNEGLRARVAQEMYASGDWVVPRLYGQPIFSKPPLMYWLICLFSLPCGEVTTVTARLPSVLAGVAVVALFLWHFRRCLGKQAGYLAALIVPLSIFWLDKVPSAEIDAVQVAWVVGAIVFFLRALEAEEDPGRAGGVSPLLTRPNSQVRSAITFWLLSALCLAAGTLTKWTAPAFLYGTAIPLLWYRGRLRLLLGRRHLLALSLAVSLVLGWIWLAVSQTSVREFIDAIVREAAPRLVPAEHPKGYSWLETLLHPFVVLGVMLPWSLALLFSRWQRQPGAYAARLAVDQRAALLYQALHCWLWPNLLFWSLHPDHTLRNRAPLFPAIAGLAVFFLLACQRRASARLASPRVWLTCFLVVWTTIKAVQVNVIIPRRSDERRVREKAITLAALLPAGAILHLCRVKDECLLFYLGVRAQRVDRLADLPSGPTQFCILTEEEWHTLKNARPCRLLLKTADGQGRPICLVAL